MLSNGEDKSLLLTHLWASFQAVVWYVVPELPAFRIPVADTVCVIV